MPGVLHQGDGGVAQLRQIERADVAGHADGDAQCVVGQDGGERDRQKGRLGGGAVVVGDEIDRLPVDVPEQLLADAFEFGLGVTGRCTGHIPAVGLAEVALAVHIGHQQALVAPAHADHGVVDGRIAVGVQVHGAAHDVGGFGAGPLEQAHAVHRVQQFAVGGFEAVDLRQSAGDDDAHRIGHIVGLQRAGDGVFQHTARIQDLNAVAQLRADRLECFLCCSFCHSLSSLSNRLIRIPVCHRKGFRIFPKQVSDGWDPAVEDSRAGYGIPVSLAWECPEAPSAGSIRTHPDRPDTLRRALRCAPCVRRGCRPAAGRTRGRSPPHRWAAP